MWGFRRRGHGDFRPRDVLWFRRAATGCSVRAARAQTLAPTMIGIVIGAAAAVIATRLLASMVYGVTPLDPATFAMAGFTLVAAALTATWLPARRASRMDPLIALRSQ